MFLTLARLILLLNKYSDNHVKIENVGATDTMSKHPDE